MESVSPSFEHEQNLPLTLAGRRQQKLWMWVLGWRLGGPVHVCSLWERCIQTLNWTTGRGGSPIAHCSGQGYFGPAICMLLNTGKCSPDPAELPTWFTNNAKNKTNWDPLDPTQLTSGARIIVTEHWGWEMRIVTQHHKLIHLWLIIYYITESIQCIVVKLFLIWYLLSLMLP